MVNRFQTGLAAAGILESIKVKKKCPGLPEVRFYYIQLNSYCSTEANIHVIRFKRENSFTVGSLRSIFGGNSHFVLCMLHRYQLNA